MPLFDSEHRLTLYEVGDRLYVADYSFGAVRGEWAQPLSTNESTRRDQFGPPQAGPKVGFID